MRVILGYLLREAIPASFAYDTSLDQKWISEIRDYIPSEPIRSGTLYVAQKGTVWGTADEMPGTIPVFLPELPSEEIPRSFAPIIPKAASEFRSCIQALRDELHILEKWNLAMYKAACSGCGLEELLNMAGNMTPNHIYVADMSFKVLAYTDRPYMSEMSATWRYQITHGYLPVHVMKGLIENGEFEKLDGYRTAAHHYSQSFYVPFVTRNIYYKNRPQAHLFVVNMITRPCFKDLELAQVLGDFLEQNFYLLSKYKVEQIGSNFEAFFNDVLTGSCTDENVIQNQIGLMGWKSDDRYGIAIIDILGRDEGLWNTIMYEIESKTKWMCFHHANDLVVVSDITVQSKDSYRPMLRELAERYNVQICIGLPFRGFLELGTQYGFLLQMRALAQQGKGMERQLYIDVRDYSLDYLLERVRANPILRSLCSADAVALHAHDAANGTEYFPTYLAFLQHDRNLVKTAQILHIHRNTLVYRLEKIHELIQTDEEDPIQKLHLLLSMMVMEREQRKP